MANPYFKHQFFQIMRWNALFVVFGAVLLFLVISAAMDRSVDTTGYPHLEPAQAQELIRKHADDPTFFILDVRTSGEYARGHLQGALLADFHGPGFRAQLTRMDHAATYLVHCATGSRSSATLNTLRELGFAHVYHLDGGINRWASQGLPIVTD